MGLRNKFLIIWCVLLLLFNFILLTRNSDEIVSTLGSDDNNVVDRYQSSYIDLLENDGLVIQDLLLLDVMSNTEKMLSELLNNDSTLFICRVSQFHCQDCSSYALEKAIKMFENDSTEMRLVFLCDYEYRSLKIFMDNHPNLTGYEVYQAPIVNLPIESRIHPYYFTLSNNMVANDIFLPNIDDPVRTEIFWTCICQKWK